MLIGHDEYLRLSALLNLQLTGTQAGRENQRRIVLDDKPMDPEAEQVVVQGFEYLDLAYGQRRRRVGTPAVIHPLRVAALLCRAMAVPSRLDLLTGLLHDKIEDITPARLGKRWNEVEEQFQALVRSIDSEQQWFLGERLQWLTRYSNQSYFEYIRLLLSHASTTPELVRVKLADRLDNVMDLHIELTDPLDETDFFRVLFNLLYSLRYRGCSPSRPHPPQSAINGAQRLYQLKKTAVVLSLVRQHGGVLDPAAQTLFDATVEASSAEARRIALHLASYHLTDTIALRVLLDDVMDYARAGGVDCVTMPGDHHKLDGLFVTLLEDTDRAKRARNLAVLYEDKALMFAASIAFVVVFNSFAEDPKYFVQNIGVSSAQSQEGAEK